MDLTQGGQKGHEEKSFEQELTEETEANPKQFLANRCKSFTSVAVRLSSARTSLSSCPTRLIQCPLAFCVKAD